MTTTPTQLPVPSEKPQDLKFNAGKIDEFVTSMGWTYTDRFGNKHYTIEGINYLAQQVMNAFGYINLTGVDFDTGATISTPNEVLFNPDDNSYYKWTGSFATGPKVVPANSTPESTGGVGPGKWLNVGDLALRSEMASPANGLGDALVTVKQPFPHASIQTQHDFNAMTYCVFSWDVKADGAYDDAPGVQQCLDDIKAKHPAGACVYLPRGEYRFSKTVIIPDRINIFGDGAGTQMRPIAGLIGVVGASVLRFDYGPSTSGAFARDFTITGDDVVKGIDTTLKTTDAVIRQVYALNLSGITTQLCSVGFEMQGWWHSSMRDCRAGGCNVGLRLLGQCVSIHIDSCKFTGKGLSQPSSIGIDVIPESYAWSGGNPVVSESILIDGETMCISTNVGIYSRGSLHMHISHVTLDFIGATGLVLAKNNANFSIRDTWIAAQSDSTKQFVGVDLQAMQPSVLRNLSGLEIRADNANQNNNNIGINIGTNVANVNISECAASGGESSIFGKTVRNVSIKGCTFAKRVYIDDVDGLILEGNYLTSLVLINSPVGRDIQIGQNNNIDTKGVLPIPLIAGAVSGAANIPSPVTGVVYGVRPISVSAASSKDTVSISGSTITIQRPVAAGTPLAGHSEYFIMGN